MCAGKVQGQLFFAQLKPISIRLCAQCVAKRRREGEKKEQEEESNVDQPHYALYAMENLFIILRVSLLLFAGRPRTPIGLPTTPACHPNPLQCPDTTPRLTRLHPRPQSSLQSQKQTPCVAATQFCALLLKLFRCASSISQSELVNCSPVEMKSSQSGKTITFTVAIAIALAKAQRFRLHFRRDEHFTRIN